MTDIPAREEFPHPHPRAGTAGWFRTADAPALPPPANATGVIGWARLNLFSSIPNTILTLLALWLLWLVVPPVISFAFVHAVWNGTDRQACLGPEVGACWAFVKARFAQFVYGRYPLQERWRVDVFFVLLSLSLLWLAIPRLPLKRAVAVFTLVVLPIVTLILLTGGAFAIGWPWWLALVLLAAIAAGLPLLPVALGEPMTPDRRRAALQALRPFAAIAIVLIALSIDWGLPRVETALWGGLLVTLVVAITGIVASLPLGVLLALGRRSTMPFIRWLSIAFIELWRGVPLITVLFMSSVMLPLFLPTGVDFDKLLRALVGVALFDSAYMAEVVRGGLQAVPKGQYEGADALGLSHWQKMRMIILPQALKLVIPGIMNSFIALFKDTSLVLIIGLFDLLGIIRLSLTDPKWATPVTAVTGYLFAAFGFWIFCFGMSRYAAHLERRLDTGRH